MNNVLREELAGIPVVANFATTAADEKVYQVEYYNRDMILLVGYRVKSSRGIKFRRWANRVLAILNPAKLGSAFGLHYLCHSSEMGFTDKRRKV